MQEDTETQDGAGVPAAADTNSESENVLAGQGAEAGSSAPEGSQDKETKPTFNLDEEVEFEAAGKQYRKKLGDIVKLFESDQALTEKEKAFLEKEKSLNRDYTQKSQTIAQFRKDVESNFGRFPEKQELQALGKLWKAYFQDGQARQAIDQILSGGTVGSVEGGRGNVDPYIRQLEQKIAQLEERHNGFASSIEEREQQARSAEGQRIWSGWVKSKEAQGIKITPELDNSMAPFVSALRQANPDLTNEQILDAAYKHATIDQLKQDATNQALVSADKAKKQGMIRISPKGGAKSDKETSYREMFLQNAS